MLDSLFLVVASLRTKHSWLAAVLLLVSCQSADDRTTPRDLLLAADSTTIQALVPENATIESLLRQQHVPAEVSASVVEAIRGVFNPRGLRADQTYWVTRRLDGIFREFRYQIDPDTLLRAVFKDDPAQPTVEVAAELVTLPKEFELSAVSAVISQEANSLSAAFEAQGENFQLPRVLAEIFGGEVDFNSDLQRGDRIEVLFERATRDGEFVGYGDVQAARHRNRRPPADGVPVHGRRRQGRRGSTSRAARSGASSSESPLPFDPRVTSRFSTNRFHPVHRHSSAASRRGLRRADGHARHTPSRPASSDPPAGRARRAGMVRIRHAGGYETAYLHLSGFGAGHSRRACASSRARSSATSA